MEHLRQLHANLLFTILLVFVVIALWSLISYVRKKPIAAYIRALLIIGELLILSTFLIGVTLWTGSLRPSRPEAHIMYGFVALVSPLVMLADLQRHEGRSVQLRLLMGAVFVCAIVLRALLTGR